MKDATFVNWFRNSAPYINAFRGKTFVISFGGETVASKEFPHLIHDFALLNSLGIQLILVFGARPQIASILKDNDKATRLHQNCRITDHNVLPYIKQAVGILRMEIEALLSMGLANSPMAGAKLQVVSGNFITAQPIGIKEGVDFHYTGQVRRVDAANIQCQLSNGAIVLISPIGYSPTGELFNMSAEEVACETAIRLQADKLIYLTDSIAITDSGNKLINEFTITDANQLMSNIDNPIPTEHRRYLEAATRAGQQGVRRIHLLDRRVDGAILLELFTRDGVGTLITSDIYEGIRPANIEDVGGIIELITPLEEDGLLVRRSRDLLETEIDQFTVLERDGMIIGCAALYVYLDKKMAELACLAIHPSYRKAGRGHTLFLSMQQQANKLGLDKLYALTTGAAHWFEERGFSLTDINSMPVKRQALYNYKRNSKVFVKTVKTADKMK